MPRNCSLPPHLELRRPAYYWRRRLPQSFRTSLASPPGHLCKPKGPNWTPSEKLFLCYSLRTHFLRDAKILARRLTEISDLVFAADAEMTMTNASEVQPGRSRGSR